MRCAQCEGADDWIDAVSLPAIVESGLNEAGTAVAVIVHPERGVAAIVEYLNQPFSAVVRRSAEELTGAKLQVLLDLVAQADCRDRLIESMHAGSSIQLDMLLKLEGGDSWFGLRVSYPPPGVSGVRHAILIGRDITQARKNATQDDKMRQLLAQIFMRIHAPAAIMGREGELIMTNIAYRQLVGFSADELKRIRVQDLTPPDYVETLAKARELQFGDGKQFEIDFETLVKGGGRVPVRLTSVLLSDSDQSYRLATLLPRPARSEAAPVIATSGEALAAIFSSNATLDGGELRAVNLEALRESFGSNWERIAVRAMLRVEHIIRKRLQRDDLLSRMDDGKFAIWFSGDDRKHNSAMLESIVRELRLTLLTEFGEELSTLMSAMVVPGSAPEPDPVRVPTGQRPKPVAPQYTRLRSATGASVRDERELTEVRKL